MEWGFSLVSQKAVNATDLEHGDARRLQVVCPVCSEALFLRIRERPRHHPHLAHYRRSSAADVDCELRVLSMERPPSIEPKVVVPREQELARFFADFENYVTIGFSDAARVVLMQSRARMKNREVYRSYLRMFRESSRQVIETVQYNEVVANQPIALDTPEFRFAIKQTIAFLLAPNSFEALLFASVYGLLNLVANMTEMSRRGEGGKRGPSPSSPTVDDMRLAASHIVFDSQRELAAYFRSLKVEGENEIDTDVVSCVHLAALTLVASTFVRVVSQQPKDT